MLRSTRRKGELDVEPPPTTSGRSSRTPDPSDLSDPSDQADPSDRAEPSGAAEGAGGPIRDRLHDRHVLIVGINYAPETTGVGPSTTALAEHLARQAASVTVLTGLPHHPDGPMDARYHVHRRLVQHPPNGSGPLLIRLSHHDPTAGHGLGRAAYETSFLSNVLTARPPRRPDLVVSVLPSPGGGAAAARLARRYGTPLLVLAHELLARGDAADEAEDAVWAAGLGRRLERSALIRADRVVVVSDELRPALRRYGIPADRIRLVPHWTGLEQTPRVRDEARRRLGWRRESFVIAHADTGPRPEFDTVIEAARRLPAGMELMLIGERQHRLGLAAADVLLLTDDDRLRPTDPGPADCLAAGRPVLAAADPDGATATTLRETGAALVIRPGDPGLLAAALVALHRDERLRTAMGRAGLASTHQRIDRADSLQALQNQIESILPPHP